MNRKTKHGYVHPCFFIKKKRKLLCGVLLLTSRTAELSAFCIRSGMAEFPPNPPSATPSRGRFFFSAEFEAVFYKAKCVTKRDVALDPPNPFVGNAKELPKDSFTKLFRFVIIEELKVELLESI